MYLNPIVICLVLATAFLAGCRSAQTESDTSGLDNIFKRKTLETKERVNTDVSEEQIILSFAGKGTALAWDAGVLKVLYKNIKNIRDNKVILTGSSSGAVWAAYFACYGINQASIDRMQVLVKKFDKKLVNDGDGKTWPVLLGQEYKLAYPHSNLDEFINLGLNDMKCKVGLPTVIAAGNVDTLARQPRFKVRGKLRTIPFLNGDLARRVDVKNNNVYTSFGKFRGKACTYFVDQTMFDAMIRIPPDVRKCDLRLMETAEDMKDAILASVSEPTYFDFWEDRDPSKIVAYLPNKDGKPKVFKGMKSRKYNGGFPMTVVVEDVKRIAPTAYSVSTGRFPLHWTQREFVEHWYVIDGNYGMFQGVWWLDADFVPTPDFWAASEKKEWSAEKEIEEGEKAALSLLKAQSDARPRVDWMKRPAHSTIRVNGVSVDATKYRDRGIRIMLDKQAEGTR